MTLKDGTVNPLAVAGLRRVDFCPPHFTKFPFNMITTEKVILDWLYENLEGRFYLGKGVSSDETGLSECIGFELHEEASYFALILSQINKYPQY